VVAAQKPWWHQASLQSTLRYSPGRLGLVIDPRAARGEGTGRRGEDPGEQLNAARVALAAISVNAVVHRRRLTVWQAYRTVATPGKQRARRLQPQPVDSAVKYRSDTTDRSVRRNRELLNAN